jgi:cysteine desulfurase
VIDAQPALALRIAALLCGYRLVAELSTRSDARLEAATLALGERTLRRVVSAADVCYLLDDTHAFIGTMDPASLADVLPAGALLCPATEAVAPFCTGAQSRQEAGADLHLAAADLATFLAAHPDAVLVDVREAFEHAAAQSEAINVPLGRLAQQIPAWLARPVPLVFFCRAGNRSLRAAQCLRDLGHPMAWSLSGGVALAGTLQRHFALAA